MASRLDSDMTEYLYRRAEQELEHAQRAEHPAAVKAHYTLAGYYLDKVYGGDALPGATRAIE